MIKWLLSILLILAICLSGFKTPADEPSPSNQVKADIYQAIGIEPLISSYQENSILTNITLTFDSIPTDKTNQEVVKISKEAISANFKQEAQNLTINYALSKSWRNRVLRHHSASTQ